ncbi:MAG: 6-bladed beta-propeller, partial [Gemmatimonadaceae bacterium]
MLRLVIVALATLAFGMTLLGTDRHAVALELAADTVRYSVFVSIDEEHEPRAAELGEIFGLAVDKNGDVYVADISNAVVLVFGRDGKFRGTVGRKGRGPGEFGAPTGIVIDER